MFLFLVIQCFVTDLIAKDRNKVQEILQYICLLIPTWNRKQMYLILRFMDKIAKNMELKLSKDLPNKELVSNQLVLSYLDESA